MNRNSKLTLGSIVRAAKPPRSIAGNLGLTVALIRAAVIREPRGTGKLTKR